VIDITERKRAEDSLRESENKFKDLAEKSLVGIYLIQDNVFKYINPRLAQIHGYEVEELLEKKGPLALVHPDDYATVKDNIDKRLSGEIQSIGYAFKLITKNGDVIFVEAYGSRTTYQGRPAIVGSLIDITRRKAAEEALVQERQRFQLLAENAPFGMALVDSRSFTYVNPKFTEMLGYTIEDLREPGQWFRLAYPDRDYRRSIINGWLSDSGDTRPGERKPRTYTTCTKDGRPREVSFIAVRVNESEILITCIDITQHKLLEAQLLQSQKMEAVGTLAGGIAHDFNNILMTILGYTSLMRMNTDPRDPQHERFRIIEEQVKSGTDLTRQLLGFARGGKYEIKPTNLNELAAKSADMFGRTRRELTIRMKQNSDLWIVETDRGQIEQVLLNLLVNAWQAMPGGGYIYIETDNVVLGPEEAGLHELQPGRYVKVSMTDTGVGMDAATQKRIFEPFFTTKEMGLGSGLGLASAYGIIKNHNGTITVDSEKGKGSVFDVYLPASDKEAAGERPAFTEELLTGSETILIVDDQEEVAVVAREMLEALGYAVVVAKNGEEAISTYTHRKNAIDLVMMDMVMPEMNGRQAYSELKKIDPAVKVILASGYSLDGQAADILKDGCAGFIQKPFTIGTISRKIRAVLDSP
jgi:PAS domain S-box-containing protein